MKIDLKKNTHRLALFQAFTMIMETSGHGKNWAILPAKNEEDCWDVGVMSPITSHTMRLDVCFSIVPEDMIQIFTLLGGKKALPYVGYRVLAHVSYPGHFNPKDGGEPPWSEEEFVSRHDNLADALFAIAAVLNDQRLSLCREHLEYSLMALEEMEECQRNN
jgi:hypothetical protein